MLYVKIPALPKILHQTTFGPVYQAYLDDDIERPLPFTMTLYRDNTHVFDIRTIGLTLGRSNDACTLSLQRALLEEAYSRGMLPKKACPTGESHEAA